MANKRIAGITVEIGGDTTKLGKALDDVDKKSRALKSELREVDKALKLDPTNVELLAQKQEILGEAIQNSRKKLDTLREAQEDIEKQFKSGDIGAEQYRAFKREVEKAEAELKSYEKQAEEAGKAVDNSGNKAEEAGKDYKKSGDEAESAGKDFEGAGDKAEKLGTAIKAAGAVAAAAAAGIAVAAKKSYDAWSEVDEGYDTIIEKTGATGEQLEELQGTADKLFGSMNVEMSNVGEAVGEVSTRFGAQGEQLDELSEAFLQYSTINKADVTSSIDNVSGAMKAFGEDSENTVNVLGQLTSISQRTGIDISSLESTLLSNSATFKELGLSIGESAELLGQMEINGVDTSTALAGLKKAQQNATAEGKTLSESLGETITRIKTAGTETEALQEASELFGKKGAAAMAQAIREERFTLDDLAKSTENYGTTVADTFEATQDAPDKLKASLNELKLSAAGIVESIFSGDGEKLQSQLSKLTVKIVEKIQSIVPKIVAIVPKIITAILKAIPNVISMIATIVSKVAATLGELLPEVVKEIIGIIPTIALALSNAIPQIITAIYGMITAILNEMPSITQALVDALPLILDAITNYFENGFPEMLDAVLLMFDALVKAIPLVLDVLEPELPTIIDAIIECFSRSYPAVLDAVFVLLGALLDAIPPLMVQLNSQIPKLISTIIKALINNIPKLFDTAKQVWSTLVDGLWSVLEKLGTVLKTAFEMVKTSFFEPVVEAAAGLWDKVKGFFTSFGENVADTIGSALKSTLNAALRFVEDKLNLAIDFINSALEAINKLPGVDLDYLDYIDLPRMAKGGVLSEGSAVVAEAGPELLSVLGGKVTVTPLTPTSSTTPSKAVGTTNVYQSFTINATIANDMDIRRVSQQLGALSRQQAYAKGAT